MAPHAKATTRRTLPLRDRGLAAPLERGVLVIAGLHGASATAINNVIRFTGDRRPDRIVVLAPQHGWCDTTQRSCEDFAASLDALSQAHDRPVVIQTNSLPPPGGDELAWSRLCTDALQRNNAVLHTGILPIAPGWYSLCANDGPESGYPGSLAIGLARALCASVICGGTNTLGVIGETSGAEENQCTLWGAEIGSMATPPSTAWATRSTIQGIVLLKPQDRGATPTTVAIGQDKSFGIGFS